MTTDRGALEKRSMRVAELRTSIALEPAFWQRLEGLARARSVSLPTLVAGVAAERDRCRPGASLASALRVHALLSGDGASR